MTKPYDAVLAVRELHKPEPAEVPCDSETWSTDHYGPAVDPYWIRCTLTGRHDEHGDPGNTGCTWPLDSAERAEQSQIPAVCEVDGETHPCRTRQLVDVVEEPKRLVFG